MHVVVLAYGPAPVTKKAVRRARLLKSRKHKIVVVAASPTGAAAIANLNPADKAPSLGRAGLAEAFAGLPDEPTLLIHDDVVITERGTAALHTELGSGTRYVVPFGNDRGMDTFIGSLPVGSNAERELDLLPAPPQSAPVQNVRPSCILATRADLEPLLIEPITDPSSILDGSVYSCKAAANALAAHEGGCATRLIADDPEGKPLVVAALIVKNEEKMLPECLESLQGFVDRIEVCDTGSTDRTIEIARAAGAHVTQRDWPDNFATARNYVLEQCRDARYVLSIDADERLDCPEPQAVRSHLATYSADYPVLSVGITNVLPGGTETTQFHSVRLFSGSGIEYRGAIHEIVYNIDGVDPLTGPHFAPLRLRHHGYAAEIVADKDKVRRNLELAESEYDRNPTPQVAVHLARSLAQAEGPPERILALAEEARAGTPAAQLTALTQILDLMADQYVRLGQDEQAFDISREALLLVPADDTAAAQLATAAARLGRLDELIAVADKIEGKRSVRPAHQIASSRAIFRSALVTAHAQAGDGERAVTEAFGILSDYPEGFGAWGPLVDVLQSTYGPAAAELLAPLAAKDPSGAFLEPIIRSFSSATFADFCVAYHAAGGSHSEVTRVGLLAAALADGDAAFTALASQANALDPEVRSGLVDRISSNGRPDLAAMLEAA